MWWNTRNSSPSASYVTRSLSGARMCWRERIAASHRDRSTAASTPRSCGRSSKPWRKAPALRARRCGHEACSGADGGCAWRRCLKLAPDCAVERAGTAAAHEEEQRAHADEQRIFPTALAPEKALGRRELHGHDHEDENGCGRKSGEQPQHQQDPADQFGASDQRAPEYAGREADAIEQRGIARKAHAAERSEQLLHAMRDENPAERYAQDRFGIPLHRAVNATERGNVMARYCFSQVATPRRVSSLRLHLGDGRRLGFFIVALWRRSTSLRQHPIDAEAAWPGHEQDERAAEDGNILEEVIVLVSHLRGWIFPIAMGQRGCSDEE